MNNFFAHPVITSSIIKRHRTGLVAGLIAVSILHLLTACTPIATPNAEDQVATAIHQILQQTAAATIHPSKTPLPLTEIPTQTTALTLPNCIPPNPIESAHVIEAIDGDTIRVSMNGQEYTVRYIGIDTPETADGASAKAAKQANANLVLDQDVIMVRDVNITDEFDRLLRYVMVGDVFVNQQLVADGLATSKEYPPDIACNLEFQATQSTAQASQLGIWAAAIPMIDQKAATIAVGDLSPSGSCDPSYPGVCIPPAPPDLDCGDVTFRRFQVNQPDPHHFDMDGDGIGCEGK